MHSLVGGVLGRSAQLVSVVVLTILLTPQEFGQYAANYATAFLLGGIASSGLAFALNRRVTIDWRGTIDRRRAKTVGAVLTGVAIAVGGISFGVGPALLRLVAGDAVISFPFGLAVAGLIAFNDSISGVLAAVRRTATLAKLDAFRGVGAGVLSAAGGLLFGAEGALVGFEIAELATSLVAVAVVRAYLKSQPLEERLVASPADRRSYHVAAAGVLASAITQSAIWVAQVLTMRYSTVQDYAVLALVLRIGNFVPMLPGMLTRNYLAAIGSASLGSRATLRGLACSYFRTTGLLTVAAAGLMVPAALLLQLVLGSGYSQIGWLLPLVAVGMALSAFGSAMGVLLIARGDVVSWLSSDIALAVVLVSGILVTGSAQPLLFFGIFWVIANALNVVMRVPGARLAIRT